MNAIRHSIFAALILGLIGLSGCGDSSTGTPSANPVPEPSPPKAKGEKKAEASPVDKKVEAPKKLTDEQIAEIKKLPEADQKVAMAQMTCPIGGDNLGEMGAPIKLVLNGKDVFICCAGCEKEAKKNPEATLAKLGKN